MPRSSVASFIKEVNLRLAKRPLETNGRLVNRGFTSLVREATGYNTHFSRFSSGFELSQSIRLYAGTTRVFKYVCRKQGRRKYNELFYHVITCPNRPENALEVSIRFRKMASRHGKAFCFDGPLWHGSTGHQQTAITGSRAELWCVVLAFTKCWITIELPENKHTITLTTSILIILIQSCDVTVNFYWDYMIYITMAS